MPPPESRVRAASFMFAGGSLAIVLGVPLGTWFGRVAGWRATFAVLGVLCLVSFAAIAALLPGGSAGERNAVAATSPDARRFRLLVVTVMLAVGGSFIAYTYIAEFLTDVTGFPDAALGPLLLANGIADIVGLTIAGIVVDRGPRALLAPSVPGYGFLLGARVVNVLAYLVLWRAAVVAAVSSSAVADPKRCDRVRSQVRACENLIAQRAARRGGAMQRSPRGRLKEGAPAPDAKGNAINTAALAVIAVDGPARARAPTAGGAATIDRTLNRFEDDGTVRGQDH